MLRIILSPLRNLRNRIDDLFFWSCETDESLRMCVSARVFFCERNYNVKYALIKLLKVSAAMIRLFEQILQIGEFENLESSSGT